MTPTADLPVPVTIRQVANGFIVEPFYGDASRCQPLILVHVFNTFEGMADWLAERFKLKEPTP